MQGWRCASCLASETIKLLIKAGSDELVHMARPDGYSCLKIACYPGHAAVADALAQAKLFVIGGEKLLDAAVDINRSTAVEMVAKHGHADVTSSSARQLRHRQP
jgi:hypothetical protein